MTERSAMPEGAVALGGTPLGHSGITLDGWPITLLGVGLCLLAVQWIRASSAATGPLRIGPWPGLSFRGAGLVMATSVLLAGGQGLLGQAFVDVQARAALPYLPLAAILSLAALVTAVRLVPVPGIASGTCGFYLLVLSVVSLLSGWLAPPALLLPGAMALDLACWLRASDLRSVADMWPTRNPRAALQRAWRPRDRRPRLVTPRRVAIGGAAYGLLLSALEPPFALLLGSPPAQWTSQSVVIATAVATIGCVVAGVGLLQVMPLSKESEG